MIYGLPAACNMPLHTAQWLLSLFSPVYTHLCIHPLTSCEMHVQVGVFQVVHLGASAEQAYQRVQPLQPFVPFRDASCGPPSFNLSVQHCIQVKHQPYPYSACMTEIAVIVCGLKTASLALH